MALLLRGQARSDKCFGTPTSATTLLLLGQVRSDQCFGTAASATTLLLRGQARSDQCFGTATSATTLLLVLRHFCYMGRHVLISASALLLCATAPQYCTVPSGTYYAVSYSFLITGLGNPIVI